MNKDLTYEELVKRVAELENIVCEQNTVNEDLQKSELRFRTLIENQQDVIWTVDENLVLDYVSPSCYKMTGRSEDKLLGSSFDRFFKRESFNILIDALEEQKTKKPDEIRIHVFELEQYHRDGHLFPVELTCIPIIKNNSLAGIQGITRDITVRKKAEEALRKSEERIRAILDNSPIAIWCYDGKEYTYLSAELYRFIGHEKDPDSIKQKWPELIHPDDIEELNLTAAKGWEAKTAYEVDYRIKAADGNYKLIHSRVFPVLDSDGILQYFQGFNFDITEQKKLESQLQQALKMKSLGTLAGGIAHDFNNLLMAIQGRVSLLLLRKNSTHSDFEHLSEIENYIRNAADLTRQLLGFARGGKYETKPTDLNELIKKQNRLFGRTKKEVTIRGKYCEKLWSVEVDQGQIQQVLLNLYVNACQAMPEGGNLLLQTENMVLDENYVKITVTDTGIGMNAEVKEQIFEPFFTTKEMGRGTGLGLSSVFGIIKNHNGFINVKSKENCGSSFMIYLPASDKSIIHEKKPEDNILKGSGLILLIDDEKMLLEVAGEMLTQLGYRVITAGSGYEAITKYQANKERIDLVILDMIMPNMSGIDTYKKLKEINSDIKVLLSSGYSMNDQVNEIMSLGCNGFIQKPFRMKNLSKKLREVFR